MKVESKWHQEKQQNNKHTYFPFVHQTNDMNGDKIIIDRRESKRIKNMQ